LKYLAVVCIIVFSGSCVIAASADVVVAKAADSAAARKSATPRPSGGGSSDKAAVKHIIFGEQKIEGKIRRPQLVLIKADQRPDFPPMVSQPLGKTRNIAALVDPSLIEAPHKGAFQFQGTKIINPAP
jgi:hypothetical protein